MLYNLSHTETHTRTHIFECLFAGFIKSVCTFMPAECFKNESSSLCKPVCKPELKATFVTLSFSLHTCGRLWVLGCDPWGHHTCFQRLLVGVSCQPMIMRILSGSIHGASRRLMCCGRCAHRTRVTKRNPYISFCEEQQHPGLSFSVMFPPPILKPEACSIYKFVIWLSKLLK